MIADHPDPADGEFGARLAAYQEALAAGRPPQADTDAPAALRLRLERAQAVLRLLEQERRRRFSAQTAPEISWPELDSFGEPARRIEWLGRFRVVRELGRGGHGVVFQAHDPVLGRDVALKVPRPEALVDPVLRRRFLREAQAAGALDHPGVVPVYETGDVGGVCYIASAYCPGRSLAKWLASAGEPAPARAAAEMVARLAEAAQYLHARGVLHRDLKPANVLLTGAGCQPPEGEGSERPSRPALADCVPRITDFGLAKLFQEAAAKDTALTHSGDVLGTAQYMAPEQVEGAAAALGPAADVYSLGAILYEVLTSRPPLQGKSQLDTLRRLAGDVPLSPRRLRPDVPRDLEAICLKCLEKKPQQRYPTAAALAEDLRRFLAGRPTWARPIGAWVRAARWCRRHWAAAALCSVVTIALPALVAGTYLYIRQLREQDEVMLATVQRHRSTAALAEAQRAHTDRLQGYAASIRLASQLWTDRQDQVAHDALARYLPAPGTEDVRGFEWHYLWRQLGSVQRFPGHRQPVGKLAFSPDGRRCASASTDGVIHLWDARGGRPLAGTLRTAPGQPHALQYSPDGRQLVVATSDRDSGSAIRVWDTATGELVRQRTGPEYDGFQAAVSPDGRTVAQGVYQGAGGPNRTARVRLWDVTAGRERILWQQRRVGLDITALCFGPADPVLAVSYDAHSSSGTATAFKTDLIDLPTGEVRVTLGGHHKLIHSLAFAPDGATLASGSYDGSVKLWDVATGRPKATLNLGQSVSAVTFAPDGRTLAVGTWPYVQPTDPPWFVSLWDVASRTRLAPELRLSDSVHALAYAPDGRTLAVAGLDAVVRLWQPARWEEFVSLRGHQPAEAWAVAFTPDGQTLVSGGDDHAVRLWDRTTGRQRGLLRGHGSLVTCVAVSPDGKRIAAGSFDKVVKVWDVATGQVAFTGQHRHIVNRVAFSPDGRLLASSDRKQTVRVWDAATGAPTATLTDHEKSVCGLTFVGPELLATGCDGGRVRLWDLSTGQARWVVEDRRDIFSLACSPDGKVLASGNQAGLVRLWEAATGRELRVLQGHTQGGVHSVAFSPDGKTLASAGEDKTIRLWQVATGLELLSFNDQPHFINGVAFSPDGRCLAAALHNGSIRLWQYAAAPE
jgi:WD40 repeat protein/predicted Ser/Thr protein kinase